MNEYTNYILDKCLNDDSEKELHDKIESLAQMRLLGLLSVRSFISEVELSLAEWNTKMIPEKDREECLLTVMYIESKLDTGDFEPREGITKRVPTDDKDNFFKHLSILMGVDFTWLSFQIFKHYKEAEENGNR